MQMHAGVPGLRALGAVPQYAASAGWCAHPIMNGCSLSMSTSFADLYKHSPNELFRQLLLLPVNEGMKVAAWGILHTYVQLALQNSRSPICC